MDLNGKKQAQWVIIHHYLNIGAYYYYHHSACQVYLAVSHFGVPYRADSKIHTVRGGIIALDIASQITELARTY